MRALGSLKGGAITLSVAMALLGCSEPDEAPADTTGETVACREPLELSFTPDTQGADEAYVCYGFDSSAFSSDTIAGVRWRIPSGGAYFIHHVIIYAVAGDYPDGPSVCDGMPASAVQLHVWSPGGDDLALPADVGLALPTGTKRFVVEAHLLHVGDGATDAAGLEICAGPATPVHKAALMGTGAPVPAIRPQHEESSSGTCVLAGDVHLYSVWPHMHLVGTKIAANLLRTRGDTTPLVDIASWDFHHQRTYLLDVDAIAGDQIQVACIWDNPSAEYVLPGPRTEDEMCNAAFIAWPDTAAVCN